MKSKVFVLIPTLILLILPFSYGQNFLHDIEEAKNIATKESKPILMIFSGSDWCKPCIQLKNKVLSTDTFTAFSDNHLVLLELDFPYKRKNRLPKVQQKHNEKLAEQYNPKGQFPMMVLIKSDGSIIENIEYNHLLTAEDYVRLMELKDIN